MMRVCAMTIFLLTHFFKSYFKFACHWYQSIYLSCERKEKSALVELINDTKLHRSLPRLMWTRLNTLWNARVLSNRRHRWLANSFSLPTTGASVPFCNYRFYGCACCYVHCILVVQCLSCHKRTIFLDFLCTQFLCNWSCECFNFGNCHLLPSNSQCSNGFGQWCQRKIYDVNKNNFF